VRILLHLVTILLMGAAAVPASAADRNLPLPRFVTLKSDQVNLRTGPGDRYPIEWGLERKELPVEIVAEFEHWRKIRVPDGTEGWVHQRMLHGHRSVIIREHVRALHRDPQSTSAVVARLEPGVIARLQECKGMWCRVEVQNVAGWLARDDVWGVYPDEIVQ
jgi:SH3-like domain-containing protein